MICATIKINSKPAGRCPVVYAGSTNTVEYADVRALGVPVTSGTATLRIVGPHSNTVHTAAMSSEGSTWRAVVPASVPFAALTRYELELVFASPQGNDARYFTVTALNRGVEGNC